MAPPVLSVWRELWQQQAPIIAALLAAGYVVAAVLVAAYHVLVYW